MNYISPGIMGTRLAGGEAQKGSRKAWLEKSPMGIGDPEDLTGAVVLLCSEAGRFITGTDVLVDGEFSLSFDGEVFGFCVLTCRLKGDIRFSELLKLGNAICGNANGKWMMVHQCPLGLFYPFFSARSWCYLKGRVATSRYS